MRFKRNIAEASVEPISQYLLPMRGSRDLAFVEMNFRWESDYDATTRLRKVDLPSGFILETISNELIVISDPGKYPRAVIRNPEGDIPTIIPVKRFTPTIEKVKGGWRMLIREWNNVLVRGKVFSTGSDALKHGSDWLTEYKPGWDSYIARVNFGAPPPKWNSFL